MSDVSLFMGMTYNSKCHCHFLYTSKRNQLSHLNIFFFRKVRTFYFQSQGGMQKSVLVNILVQALASIFEGFIHHQGSYSFLALFF